MLSVQATVAYSAAPELGSASPDDRTPAFLKHWEALLRGRHSLAETVLSHSRPWELAGLMAMHVIVLAGLYGALMGIAGGWRQSFASMIKTPALFLSTLLICFPVLYVLNVLLGTSLTMGQVVALIVWALAFNCILLASCAPICGFFSVSGSGYHFMKLLHVSVFGLCGVYGMAVLHEALRRASSGAGVQPSQGGAVFFAWALVFGFVGTQMAWRLRPLIGEPGLPFEWFRRRRPGLNFYSAVVLSIRRMGQAKGEQLAILHPAE